MYIPIGPSKKQLYKIVIALLLLCYLLFLGMFKPKAQVVDYIMNESQTQTTSGNIAHAFNGTNGIFQNQGQGKIIYQFLVTGKRNINTIAIETDNSMSVCDFGTTSGYNDSSTQQVFYSIVCNVDLSNNNKAINLLIYGYSWENTFINWGRTVQFSNFENGNDYTQVLSNVDANLNSISSAVWSIKFNSDSIKQYIESMIINNTQINNNVSDIKDSINDSSIDSSSATDFKSNSAFQDSNGLDAIIKAPLNFIQSLTSSTCSAISLTIPYIDAQVSLPCMSTIYNKALGQQLVNLIALVINGVVLYRYCLKILQIVKDAKNPNKDGLEVLDL